MEREGRLEKYWRSRLYLTLKLIGRGIIGTRRHLWGTLDLWLGQTNVWWFYLINEGTQEKTGSWVESDELIWGYIKTNLVIVLPYGIVHFIVQNKDMKHKK